MDAVSCYVALHAFGKYADINPYPADWYTAVSVNGLTLIHAVLRGLVMYVLQPGNCRSSSHRYFDAWSDPDAAYQLISYLQSQPTGINDLGSLSAIP